MENLKNKRAVIVGGDNAIGYVSALKLKELGAQVLILGRDNKVMKELSEIPDIMVAHCEFENKYELNDLATSLYDLEYKFDILFVSADAFPRYISYPVNKANFKQRISKAFQVFYFAVNKFLPCLNEDSSIINFSVVSSHYLNLTNITEYDDLRAGLDEFVKDEANYLAARGIRINTVNPGLSYTLLYENYLQQESEQKDGSYPLKNLERIKDVKEYMELFHLIEFLASDRSRTITGGSFYINGISSESVVS